MKSPIASSLRLSSTGPPPSPRLPPNIGCLPTPGAADIVPKPGGFTKKSHARKQPPGHIPRPRNAFILFRCDFVQEKKVPQAVENDHRNISRIVGRIWREMTDEEKAPWIELAQKEKQRHAKMYPGYQYHPSSGQRSARTGKRKRELTGKIWEGSCASEAPSHKVDSLFPPRRRSSSCPPPGSMPVVRNIGQTNGQYPHILTTQDDLPRNRQPSITTMYHSVPIQTQTPSPGLQLCDEIVWPFSHGSRGPRLVSSSHGPIASATSGPQAWSLLPYPCKGQFPVEERLEIEKELGPVSLPSFAAPDLTVSELNWNDISGTFQPPMASVWQPPTFIDPFSDYSVFSSQSFVEPVLPPMSGQIPPSPHQHILSSVPSDALLSNGFENVPEIRTDINQSSQDTFCDSFSNSHIDLGLLFPRLSLDDSPSAEHDQCMPM